MCLLVLRYDWSVSETKTGIAPLVICSNRDELFARETSSGCIRDGNSYYPIDEEAGGTWIAFSKLKKRFVVVLNFHDFRYTDIIPPATSDEKSSRGRLPLDFINSDLTVSAECYCRNISLQSYNGFNLIVGDESGCFFVSNREELTPIMLEPGIVHGFSNGKRSSQWEKVVLSVDRISDVIKNTKFKNSREDSRLLTQSLIDVMRDSTPLSDYTTGYSNEQNSKLSAIFVVPCLRNSDPRSSFGTRTITIALLVIGDKDVSDDTLIISESNFNHEAKRWTCFETFL